MSSTSAGSRRFFVEFVVATVVAQVAATFVVAAVDSSALSFVLRQTVASASAAIAQWFILRRYVPWAQWWAFATLLGLYGVAGLAILMIRGAQALSDSRLLAQVATSGAIGLTVALMQYPTLHHRVARAWLWVAAVPLAYVAASRLTASAFPNMTGVDTGLTLIGQTAVRVATLAVIEGAVLAWLLRPWLDGPKQPVDRVFSRLEFLIAWSAVPAVTLAMVTAVGTSMSFQGTRPTAQIVLITTVFATLLAAGQLWVLASTGLDQRRWRISTVVGAIACVAANVLSPMLSGFMYLFLLVTRVGGLGLIPSLVQTYAVRTFRGRVLWVIAAVVGWSATLWTEWMVRAFADAANAYQYQAFSAPMVTGLIAGLCTGLALLDDVNLQPTPGRPEPSAAARRL